MVLGQDPWREEPAFELSLLEALTTSHAYQHIRQAIRREPGCVALPQGHVL